VSIWGSTLEEPIHVDRNKNLGKKEGMKQIDTEVLQASGLESSSISSADPHPELQYCLTPSKDRVLLSILN